jgi:pyruvate dehydrogenase E2 component (dihydrolipoamide acetyltransferase)
VAIGVEDIFIHVVARTLVQHRRLNASFEDEGIRYFAAAHIGVAVALDEGLVVPVVRDAHVSTLAQIAQRRAELIAKARAHRLEPADVEGGTFTISNLGKYSVEYFGALINPPQAGILSIGRIRKEAVVLGDALVASEMVGLGLTFDHRVVDGAVAGEFLSLLIDNLENSIVHSEHDHVGEIS